MDKGKEKEEAEEHERKHDGYGPWAWDLHSSEKKKHHNHLKEQKRCSHFS